jgi:hypothetical protein
MRGGAPEGPARLLVVDAGSSSVKATFVGLDGRLHPDPPVRISYGWQTAGGAMAMPATELLAAVDGAIDAVLAQRWIEAEPIRGVALTAFWHSLVGVDEEGVPVTPILGWAEGRSRHAADRLRARIDEDAYHLRTGCYVHPTYPAARLAWVREARPDWWRAARRWWSAGELLLHHLTGSSSGIPVHGVGVRPARSRNRAGGTGDARRPRRSESGGAPAARDGRAPDAHRASGTRRWPVLAGFSLLPGGGRRRLLPPSAPTWAVPAGR